MRASLHSVGFSRKDIQTRVSFFVYICCAILSIVCSFFLKRALNRVRFLFAYKSNKPHHKKYFHFF